VVRKCSSIPERCATCLNCSLGQKAIETSGTFGPWGREAPGQTPLEGTFTFEHADLDVFKGISGVLSAVGTFGGTLERIAVHGVTDTPDFTVKAGGHAMPLHATYDAIVDGTNGNTSSKRWRVRQKSRPEAGLAVTCRRFGDVCFGRQCHRRIATRLLQLLQGMIQHSRLSLIE
jgi:hypothetical protein